MIVANDKLPLVFAGPILRRTSPERLVLWLAVREPARVRIGIDAGKVSARDVVLTPGETTACLEDGSEFFLSKLLLEQRVDCT
jgi:hypothetical protein